jgi:cbb3-type cytochrome oxidase subunit 3
MEKNKDTISGMKLLLYLIICLICVSTLFYRIGYRKGEYNGAVKGIIVTLDSVQNILEKQLKSNTTASKILIINPDTNVYVLSKKTMLESVNQ